MIPATQRPDGTWRKARKTKKGFDSSAGGASRYVPPQFRGGAGPGGEHDPSSSIRTSDRNHTRSLEAVVSGRRGANGRFLRAALFLLTKTTAARMAMDDGRRDRSLRVVAACVRSAALAAVQEQLGCEDSLRPLYPEMEEPARSGRGERGRNGSEWWARLGQVELGRKGNTGDGASSIADDGWREVAGEEAWVGLELSLRPSDVGYVDGQAAIVNFLKGRLGVQAAAVVEDKNNAGGEGRNDEMSASGQPEASGKEEGNSATGENRAEAPGTKDHRSGKDSERGRTSGSVSAASGDEGARAKAERGEAEDVVVAAAVLVFGSELSKRDRAELHGQAEIAGGIASASHGVGDARFLTLSCGLGDGAAAVELQLSEEQTELARILFRLAQQEYHSRYECLSHREIREVVALGGPSAEDHPDLFRLLEKNGGSKSIKAVGEKRAASATAKRGAKGAGTRSSLMEGQVAEGGSAESVGRRGGSSADETSAGDGEQEENGAREGEAELHRERCPW